MLLHFEMIQYFLKVIVLIISDLHLIATVIIEFNWKTADRYMIQPFGQASSGPNQSLVPVAMRM